MTGAWSLAGQLSERTYLIAVDEFAEVEIPGNKVLTRDELRALCDSAKTRDAIIKALQNREEVALDSWRFAMQSET